jgi:WD40 repeat protein
MSLPVSSWADSGKLRTEVGRILNDYSCVVVSPERSWIACAHESSKRIDVLDATSLNHITSIEGHTEVVRGLCFSRKEELLVSVSHDRTLVTWDPQCWKIRHQCSGQPVRLDAAAMHPDGSTVATFDYAGRISLWDARVGRTILTVDESAPSTIGMAFSPDGRYLAAWDCLGRITVIDSNSNPLDRRPQTSSRATDSDVLRE